MIIRIKKSDLFIQAAMMKLQQFSHTLIFAIAILPISRRGKD